MLSRWLSTPFELMRTNFPAHHICIPQKPFPATIPKHPSDAPPPGAHERLLTSYSLLHARLGFLSALTPACPTTCCDTAPAALIRSHTSTRLSSAPDARHARRVGLHSTQLTAALWPLSSRRAWPGCRTSRTRITEESCEKVASKWASWGEAAMRRRGGGKGRPDADGSDVPGVGECEVGEASAAES